MSPEIPGFVSYDIDAVVKFGGSLLSQEHSTKLATWGIEEARRAGHRILVIPGGGPTDKAIEAIDRRSPLAPYTHHRACAKAQDQTGLIICDEALSTGLRPCETLEEARQILDATLTPVLLPSRIIFAIDPFERTWAITSDAMTLWFAWLVFAPVAVILTDVDGIFPPGEDVNKGAPVAQINASDLVSWGHTSVDVCTPQFARVRGITTWVLNGANPDRLVQALGGEVPIGTKILPI